MTVPSSTLRRRELEAVEGVQGGGEPFAVLAADRVADVAGPGVAAEAGEGVVGGGAGAVQRGEGVGGARVGEVDEGLAAFVLEVADGVLGGVADVLHARGTR